MTSQQRASLIFSLFNTTDDKRSETLDIEMQNLGLSEIERQSEREIIHNLFHGGIKNLNSNQLNNILKSINENEINVNEFKRRLTFYEVEEQFHENIIRFFEDYFQANQAIDVGDLDREFKGVQVASRDNFNTIINQGWSGDWLLTPENIDPKRIQIASMNETGTFPRGYYLNADIVRVEPIKYGDQIRYRVFISNPIVINTGNRNVKFNVNPVRYIK